MCSKNAMHAKIIINSNCAGYVYSVSWGYHEMLHMLRTISLINPLIYIIFDKSINFLSPLVPLHLPENICLESAMKEVFSLWLATSALSGCESDTPPSVTLYPYK